VRFQTILWGLITLTAVLATAQVVEVGSFINGYVGLANYSGAFEAYFYPGASDCGHEVAVAPGWPKPYPSCAAYGMMMTPMRNGTPSEFYFKRMMAIFNTSMLPTLSDVELRYWSMQAGMTPEQLDQNWAEGLGVLYGVSFTVKFGTGPLVDWSKLEYTGYDGRRKVYVYHEKKLPPVNCTEDVNCRIEAKCGAACDKGSCLWGCTYNYTCPTITRFEAGRPVKCLVNLNATATLHAVYVYYVNALGGPRLCINPYVTRGGLMGWVMLPDFKFDPQRQTVDTRWYWKWGVIYSAGWWEDLDPTGVLGKPDFGSICWRWDKPPANFTVVAKGNGYEVYVDGRLVYKASGPGEAWIYTGPFVGEASQPSAYVDSTYPMLWKTGRPIRAWLFVGNDTLKLPEYVSPYVIWSYGGLHTSGHLSASASVGGDGSVVVSPPWVPVGGHPRFKLNFTGAVSVRAGGVVLTVPNGTFFAPGRSCTASGRVYRVLGDSFVALGDGALMCREWRVEVERPDGSAAVFYAPNGTAFEYVPPPLDLGNGTWLVNATPIRLVATGPARVKASYGGREHLIVFEGSAKECLTQGCMWYRLHNFTEAVWAPVGRLVAVEKYAVLHNGTRLVARATAVADGPKKVPLAISREYRVAVAAPNGTAELWWPEGRPLAIRPYALEHNNGTRVEVLGFNTTVTGPIVVQLNYTVYYWVSLTTPFNKTEGWVKRGAFVNVTLPTFVDLGNKTALRSPNGTCAFVVDAPKRCVVTYRERLYWVSVQTPFNRTVGWAPEGSVVRLPEVFDMGNGTRWVGPGFYAVVNRPINVTMTYKRQYYVEVSGVVEWRGWADEGSSIRLNETVIGGVKYVPQVQTIEVRGPVSAKPRYAAYYYAQFSDALGLPNPWASVELCGRRFAADYSGAVSAVAETDERCGVRAEAPPLGPYSLAIIGAVAAVAVAVAARRLKKR